MRTAKAAELAAERILEERSELIKKVDWDYLSHQDSAVGARIKIVADNLKG